MNDWALVRRLWRRWSPGYVLPDDDWADLRRTFEQPGVRHAMLDYYRCNASFSALLGRGPGGMSALTTVPVRTLAVTGSDDGCIDTRLFDHAMRPADFPAGLRVERIDDAGHFVHREQPALFNRLLIEWLRAV
jgi:pimeloyl-ACP methyl ester carboxylesterase